MARNPDNKEAPGIYRRGEFFWLRYSVNAQQVRVSLETSDYAEAVQVAKQKRGKLTNKLKDDWVMAVEHYIRERSKAATRKRKGFSATTCQTVNHACKSFQKITGVDSPSEATSKTLERFYQKGRDQKGTDKYSEATIQGYVSKVAVFLRWCGLDIKEPEFDAESPTRDIVIRSPKIAELIRDCGRDDLRYVLLAGFMCGMRKDEIIMSRPSWFDFDARQIRVPARDGGWTPKNGRGRKIPLPRELSQWLKQSGAVEPGREWILHPEASGVRYRWDFRRPFTEYIQSQKIRCTPHSMRHSYITLLAEAGVSIPHLSEWSGDRIATLERHYLHVSTNADRVDGVFDTPPKASKELIESAPAEAIDRIFTDLSAFGYPGTGPSEPKVKMETR